MSERMLVQSWYLRVLIKFVVHFYSEAEIYIYMYIYIYITKKVACISVRFASESCIVSVAA
jgi:hypothetical protein